jgi:hypothetical protein
MKPQNLILNKIIFSPKVEEIQCSFTNEIKDGYYPIYIKSLPKNISEVFTEEQLTGIEHLYTNFSNTEENDNILTVNLSENTKFAKLYFKWLIHNYFNSIADVSKPNFISDNEYWFINKKESTDIFSIYTNFTIKVQYDKKFKQFELILSYDGTSKVLKESMESLDYDTTLYNWVVYDKQLYKDNEKPEPARYNLEQVFPVLNFNLSVNAGIPTEPKYVKNKYKEYYNQIQNFYKTYINTSTFKEIIPIDSKGFFEIDKLKIKNTTTGSNLLIFGQDQTHIAPYYGLKEYGPYKLAENKHNVFIYICHENDKAFANEVKEWFKGTKSGFSGLKSFVKLPYGGDNANSIIFKDIENPIDEIREQLAVKVFDTETYNYVAIYISPFSKSETDPDKHSVYYKVKEELLKYSITSQVIDKAKINNDGYQYYLPNIAIALVAKLKGIPWRLARTVKKELIIGVGAFKDTDLDEKYVGSASCFSNEGHFQGFECHSATDTYILAVLIGKAIKKYRQENQTVERLVIHFYKSMSKKELEPIQKELDELEEDIPIIIVSINKTESRDIVIFDISHKELIPISGTFIGVGYNQFLLCNNTRYGIEENERIEGFPFPIKIKITSNKKEIEEDFENTKNLIDQVYQFSRMYWKSVKQQNLPVTIKYPEMVAKIFPYFDDKSLPPFGKQNLWFL